MAGDDGMSLVEVIVSLSLITIVMASAGLFFVNNLRATGGQSQRQEAVFLADRQLETVQALTPDKLLTGRSSTSVSNLLASPGAAAFTSQDWTSSGNYDAAAVSTTSPVVSPDFTMSPINSIPYRIRTFINLCTLQSNGSCTPGSSEPTGNSKMYRVTVDASWIPAKNSGCGTSGCDYSASSLVDPHGDPKFNSNISHPAITSVSPTTVGAGATKTLTITGTGFVAGATVSIDTGAGTFQSVTANTGTQITVPFTGGIPGFYTLAVTNPDGGRATVPLTVTPAPDITSASPGTVNGGVQTTVTLTGTGFQTGATITASAGSAVSNVTITPSTSASLKLTAPTNGGTVTLTLTNSDGGTDTINVTAVSAPTVTLVNPSSVPVSSTRTISLTGTNFASGATLTPSAGTVSGFTVTNSTTATATFTAPATAQSVTLTFRNADGGNTTFNLSVQGPPTITSVSPSTVGGNGTVTLTLTGTNFVSGASLSASAGTLSSFTVSSSTSATVSFHAPSTAQNVTLTLTNPDLQTAPKTVTISTPPTVTAMTPTSVPQNTATTFTVTGSNFVSGAKVTLTLGGSTVYGPTVATFVDSGHLKFTLTTGPAGSYPVTVIVTNPDGGTGSKAVTVTAS
jgi:hypothetical protein